MFTINVAVLFAIRICSNSVHSLTKAQLTKFFSSFHATYNQAVE